MDARCEADARTWLAMDLLAPVHDLWAALEAAPAAQVSADGLLGEHRPVLTEAALAGELDLERALVVGAALDAVGGFAEAELVAVVECVLVDEACRLLLMPLVNAAADLLLDLEREAALVEESAGPGGPAGPVDLAGVMNPADAGGVGTGAGVERGTSEGNAPTGGSIARARMGDAARSDGARGADRCAVIGTAAGVLGRGSPRRGSSRRVSGRSGSDRQRTGGPTGDRGQRSRGPPRAARLFPTVSAGLTMVAPGEWKVWLVRAGWRVPRGGVRDPVRGRDPRGRHAASTQQRPASPPAPGTATTGVLSPAPAVSWSCRARPVR